MKVVINITEKAFELLKNKSSLDNIAESIIANGTPLPKGHGRLIDETQIHRCEWDYINNHAKTDAPTIIETDKEESEKV